jgi:hypothetical protein
MPVFHYTTLRDSRDNKALTCQTTHFKSHGWIRIFMTCIDLFHNSRMQIMGEDLSGTKRAVASL